MKRLPTLPALVAVVLVVAAACEEPYYDDNIGLEGVPTEPGALAGTFAQKAIATTVVRIPGLEEKDGGGVQFLRLDRTWDEDAQVYRQTSKLCGGENFEVHGTVADAPPSTYRAVPDSTAEVVTVNHASGEHGEAGLVQLWGIRDLDDPANDPFPTSKEEAAQEPFSSQIYDMDADDEPGYTTKVTGFANGSAWSILRRKNTLRGVVLGPDRIVGLTTTTYDSFIFGADDPLVESMMGGNAPAHPDPKKSWFEELRVSDDIDCDGVVEMDSSGAFAQLRPF